MKNEILKITKTESSTLKQELQKQEGVWIGEIDGENIKTLEDYLDKVNQLCGFPIPAKGLDGYLDWIRDLSWLRKDGYAIIIYDANKFLSEDSRIKNIVIKSFEDIVLPWWESDVERYVVEGKAKPFNVYLVD